MKNAHTTWCDNMDTRQLSNTKVPEARFCVGRCTADVETYKSYRSVYEIIVSEVIQPYTVMIAAKLGSSQTTGTY